MYIYYLIKVTTPLNKATIIVKQDAHIDLFDIALER